MNKRITHIALMMLCQCAFYLTTTASVVVDKKVEQIKLEIQRIDLIDGKEDQLVFLKSDLQSEYATQTYLVSSAGIVEKILENIASTDVQKVDQLNRTLAVLRDVSAKNVHFFTRVKPIFDLIQKVQLVDDETQLNAILKSNVFASLNLIAFYIDMPVAEAFFMAAARTEPAELIKHYIEIDYKPFSGKIIDELCRVSPMKIKTYLHTWNPVHQRVKTSQTRLTNEVYRIYQEKGTTTRAYILINDIYNGKLSIDEAHAVAKDDVSLFTYLIKMRSASPLNGEHSVDEALMYQSLKQVQLINELHEESDAVRFRSLDRFDAHEIYTLMVYSENEIYTSTFLGMYAQMMDKMDVKSSFEFLHHADFNKFRTFIKMAAGYNSLNSFLARMTEYEKQKLFAKLVTGLQNANDNLESAVAIADTYGSLKSTANKALFEKAILDYYVQIKERDIEGEQLYSLILNVFEIGGGLSSKKAYTKQEVNLRILPISRVFKDNKNIQQHFFFDDEDGRASYGHFLATFQSGNWELIDHETFVVIKSTAGKKVEMYINKPDTEFDGQDAIKAYFQETERWPDVVVHRGHSYYASAAIESLTPNAEIVFLGSCGGYNAISSVLKYSPEAQIISSKQIGTMMVNDVLCYELNEVIRGGKDIVWDDLWAKLNVKLVNESRFNDYIPPHKNLGALLIKTYREML
jgi:hypothetical protein